MRHSEQKQAVSPLISGGIFSQRVRKSSKPKPEPTFREVIKDYNHLLANLMQSLTYAVNKAYPHADFLTKQPGSHIVNDTKLSFLLRAVFGISQIKLPAELVENYRRTLKEYLNTIKSDPKKETEYAELRNIIHSFKNLAAAMKTEGQINHELQRLQALSLPVKTIDRRLRTEWSENCIQQPIADLTQQITKTMDSSERLQSFELAGSNNSLGGLGRQMANPVTRKQSQSSDESYPSMAPAAA